MMQWLSNSPTARPIDREIGTLAACCAGSSPQLRYHRYNVRFEASWFEQELGQLYDKKMLDDLACMDKPANMKLLEEIGTLAAKRFVRAEHFMQG